MYNLTNNKRRNLITSCSCSRFTMYRYYWYIFFLFLQNRCFLSFSLAFSHSFSHSLFPPLSFSLSFTGRSYRNELYFFACDLQKEKKETKRNRTNERYRLSSPSLRNCNLCSLAMTHRSDLGGTASVRGGRSLLDG